MNQRSLRSSARRWVSGTASSGAATGRRSSTTRRGYRAATGRPVVGLTLKVRYAPFFTKIYTKKVPTTFDREVVAARLVELTERIEPDRAIRLLGVRAAMAMPDDAREGHSP